VRAEGETDGTRRDARRLKKPKATEIAGWGEESSNKRMQQTSLSAAPGRRGCRLVRPNGWVGGRTGSQLIRSVRPTRGDAMGTTAGAR
jgi:hypothetical protein